MFQNTKITRWIFYTNVFFFIFTLIGQNLIGIPVTNYFALYPISHSNFQIFQFLTSMFMHAGLAHLFFNMLGLLSFGPDCENQLGERKFLVFYLLMGLGASLLQLFFTTGAMIGASGAIYGLLVFFTLLNPDAKLMIFPLPFGFKAKYLVTFLFILEVVLAFIPGGSISHWGHIGGALTGASLYFFEKYIIKNPN